MTKIFQGNQYVVRTRLQRWIYEAKRATIGSIIVLGVFCLIGWGFVAGTYSMPPKIVYADKEVIREVKAVAPVMKRIADCESGKRNTHGKGIKNTASHYNQYGQVLIKPVMTGQYAGTYDIGYYQINSTHNADANKLGLNLSVEGDNKKYGEYLYETKGTQPWNASQSCWLI